MNRTTIVRSLFLAALATSPLAARAHPLDQEALMKVVRTIDDRQRNSGDYRSLAYLEQKERVRNFEEHTRGELSRDTRQFLAGIIKGMTG